MLLETRLPHGGRVVPALLVTVAVAVTLAAASVDAQVTAGQREVAAHGVGLVSGLVGTVVTVAGAVILRSHARHAVGVVLVTFGLIWAVDGFAESWATYSGLHDVPGRSLAYWYYERFGSVLLLLLPLLLLLYPTGRFIPGRWRRVGIAAFVGAAGLPVGLLLSSDETLFRGDPPPGVRTDVLALPLPDPVMFAFLTGIQSLPLIAIPLALVVAHQRYRRSQGRERTQLMWLLWAGVVCLLCAAVIAFFPQGAITTAVLSTTVVTTAVSIAVGVVRPEIADVEALVAGTLTYAGVAGVVIGVDLAMLALVDTVVGTRLDQREVTIIVLVLAVVAYGPLRSWIGVAVGRMLFGRRGDRYQAVSSLAARLEQSQSLEDQLPALAAAVASTFKVRFVRVEVLEPDGSTMAATHGTEPADTYELGIDYHGEAVGRLVLPRQGYRAMLSRRDQHLLVDLVRQAAIAVRGHTLARELQESRERLVLAREDDRRRIRRDLHDGLGPVLGGVAMRLDAAGNAVATDPDAARTLIRQSRTDISDALDDVRRLVHDLRPPALDDLGLLAAVQQQADRARSALTVLIEAGPLDALPAAVEVAAFRIVSESLTNVVRHADATRCEIRLTPGSTALEIEVHDDGRGIAEHVSAGVGLLSLRERAEELGGQCEVTCPPGGGTLVRAWLPYGERARHP